MMHAYAHTCIASACTYIKDKTLIQSCPETNVVGLLTSFASVLGTVVATMVLRHLQCVASNLEDERQQNSENMLRQQAFFRKYSEDQTPAFSE